MIWDNQGRHELRMGMIKMIQRARFVHLLGWLRETVLVGVGPKERAVWRLVLRQGPSAVDHCRFSHTRRSDHHSEQLAF